LFVRQGSQFTALRARFAAGLFSAGLSCAMVWVALLAVEGPASGGGDGARGRTRAERESRRVGGGGCGVPEGPAG
jgi:hypothetical protein